MTPVISERFGEVFKLTGERLHLIGALAGVSSIIAEFLTPLQSQAMLWVIAVALVIAVAGLLALQSDRLEKRAVVSDIVVFFAVLALLSAGVYVAKVYFDLDPVTAIKRGFEKTDAKIDEVDKHVLAVLKALPSTKQAQIYQLNFATHISLTTLVMLQSQTSQMTVGLTPARLDMLLAQKAAEFATLQEQLTQAALYDPRAHDLIAAAKVDLANADFQAASAKVRQAAMIEKASSDRLIAEGRRRALDAARSFQRSAEIAQLSYQYRAAADDFATAAKLAGPYDPHFAWQLTTARADALYRQGDERGDQIAVGDAADAYTQAMTMVSPTQDNADWTRNRDRLGAVVERLNQRGDGAARHDNALRTYRAALDGRTRNQTREERRSLAVDQPRRPADTRTARTAMPRQRRESLMAAGSHRAEAPSLPAAAAPQAPAEKESGGFFSRFKNWVGGNSSTAAQPQATTPQQAVTNATERATTERAGIERSGGPAQPVTSQPRVRRERAAVSTGETKSSPAKSKPHRGGAAQN